MTMYMSRPTGEDEAVFVTMRSNLNKYQKYKHSIGYSVGRVQSDGLPMRWHTCARVVGEASRSTVRS
jgi:hypothetical protein